MNTISDVAKATNEVNIKRWNGFSELYHNCRPVPPAIIPKMILSWLKRRPDTVVDIGSGTGLSTIIWDGIAESVIGIEPNGDMRATAEKHVKAPGIIFQKGLSNETNLPSGCADVVTIATAFHWMDIDSTLAEVQRILKPGGVFAVFVGGYPSIIDWAVEKAYRDLSDKCAAISYSQAKPATHNGRKGISYLDAIQASGIFAYAKETACHHEESCTRQRLMDLTLTQGSIQNARTIEPSLQQDINAFSTLVQARCGEEFNVIFSYRLWIAVK